MATLAAIQDRLVIRPGVDAAYRDDGSIELSLEGQKLTLNAVGAQIWKLLKEGRSECETVDGLASLYAVDRDRLEGDVQQFVRLLSDNLILKKEETVASQPSPGVTFREILDADGPAVAGALTDALGDSYLCAHNRIYGVIRRKALAYGYRYESGSLDPLFTDYSVFALSCLGRIISRRTVPYFQTRTVLERLDRDQPVRYVSLRFLRSNLKSNYILHESSHGVAHETLAPNPYRVNGPTDSAQISTIINALAEEAFANTVERLASMEAQSHLHQSFFAWNSYMASDTADRAVLEKAHERLGDEVTFYLLWFGHVIANLYPKEPPEDLTLGLLDRIGAANTATSRNLVRMALNLNLAFRAETNPSYFQMQGLRSEYEKLCRLPVEAYLDLVETLKPCAAQLWAVLGPDGATGGAPGKAVTAPDAAGATLLAALQQQEQTVPEVEKSTSKSATTAPALPDVDRPSWLAAFDQAMTPNGGTVDTPSPSPGAKYVTIRSALQQPLLGKLYEHAVARASNGSMSSDDQVPQTPSAYGDPVMEELLLRLLPMAESATGEALYPTYSYFRVYKQGDTLKKHKDRPSCEISMTLNLGYDADSPWPISVQAGDEPASIRLEAGDALLYHGTEVEHWRDRFDGARSAQVFLHYVRQGGPHASWHFDKRAGLQCLSNSER
jgi:alkylated DNA repair dioxygenase AlkB